MDWIQWLALVGGLAAAAAFVAGRLDAARTDAARIYVVVTKAQIGGDDPFTTCKVVNDSGAPVVQVWATAWAWGGRRRNWRLRQFYDWMEGEYLDSFVYWTLHPDESTPERQMKGLKGRTGGLLGESPPVMVVFRDGRGRRWVRWPDGKLTRLNPCLFGVGDANLLRPFGSATRMDLVEKNEAL